ncbi:MAG: flotillin-like protein FloA [bacterium]|jgi:uncharacterized protein YqfA (UPF0365 family)|nr:flotillin-like protein FloA [bacterium]
MDGIGEFAGIIVVGVIFGLAVLLYIVPIPLYIAAVASRVTISLGNLVGMRMRRVPPSGIVLSLIQAVKGGIPVSAGDLETHYLSGGNVMKVVSALIAASRAGFPLNFKKAAAIDLAGRDVLKAVQMCVNPKVITTGEVAAMAKDGIQIKAVARVTVRANIEKLVGGAGEGTVLARVGEGICTAIGSADKHGLILENPDQISKHVLEKGLDAGTAFEILSIDIMDVDVGRNVGAELQIDQAEADKDVAQAKAEQRRAMAVAREQEMKALEQEMKAKVVAAQAEVPLAISESLRSGKMGLMDYYQLKNIIADTGMRASISKMGGGSSVSLM